MLTPPGTSRPDDGPEAAGLQPHTLAVERGQPLVDVRETEPGAVALADARLEDAVERLAGNSEAVVSNGHAQAAAADAGTDDEPQRPLGLAVLDRVLDERLDEERRQAHRERLGRGVDLNLELRAKARLLERQVALDVLELLGERDELAWACERPAAVVRKGEDQLAGPVWVGADEAGDRVQAVEEEMRLDLRLQGLQLGGCRGARGAGELGELQLRGELVAERGQQADVVVSERRAVGRVGDERADWAVAQPQRHDRGRAERTGAIPACDPERERRDAGLVLCERLENRPNRHVARRRDGRRRRRQRPVHGWCP